MIKKLQLKEEFKNPTFKIEKGIPIPSIRKSSNLYPFEKMEVNDSFFIPNDPTRPNLGKAIQSAAHTFGRKNNMTFAFRMVVEDDVRGSRVWRIK